MSPWPIVARPSLTCPRAGLAAPNRPPQAPSASAGSISRPSPPPCSSKQTSASALGSTTRASSRPLRLSQADLFRRPPGGDTQHATRPASPRLPPRVVVLCLLSSISVFCFLLFLLPLPRPPRLSLTGLASELPGCCQSSPCGGPSVAPARHWRGAGVALRYLSRVNSAAQQTRRLRKAIIRLPKAPLVYKGYPRDTQGIPKGYLPVQHRRNTVSTPGPLRAPPTPPRCHYPEDRLNRG